MESLLVLIGLIVLAIPVSIIVLMVGQARLRRRVEQLERQLVAQSGPHSQSDAPEADAADGAPVPVPEVAPKSQPASEPQPSFEPDATDFTEQPFASHGRFTIFAVWLKENWFYAVSALSLALAGIFLVQYGVENGLLPPSARVAAALSFGIALIAAGELVRRRFGDGEGASTVYLPSVFSGAGLVTLFGGVLAARQLYGLIQADTAMGGLVLIALIGLVLGWFHGPLLATVGLLGAFAAPFVVGGVSDDPSWLYGFFGVLTVLGLGIDTVQRWAWVSVLTLAAAYSTCLLLVLSAPSTEPGYLVCVSVLSLLAIAIPNRRLWPDHAGLMLAEVIWRKRGEVWPAFPTRLAFGAVAVSSGILCLHWADSAAEFWLAVCLQAGLALALLLWAKDAPALQDVTMLPAIGLIGFVLMHGLDAGSVARIFAATYVETPEADFPWAITFLIALAALISVLAAWRSFGGGRYSAVWAGAAALFAPCMAIALEVGWHPAQVLGPYSWALHVVALGALMVGLAERFARVDGDDRMRTALATLSALSCLAFACVIVLSSGALTIALVIAVVVAAALDRKFTLPPMSWFIWVGVFTVTVRLVLDPGLSWAVEAPIWEMALVYASATLGFVVGWALIGTLHRPVASLLLESASWATGGILLSLLLERWLLSFDDGTATNSHWGLGLLAIIWLLLAFAQVQRFELGGKLNYARYGLAVFFGGHGLVRLAQALFDANPLLWSSAPPVLGPPLVNTLTVAYLLPALVIGFSIWRIRTTPLWLKRASWAVAVALTAVWLGLSIRHVWQGASGMYEGNGMTQAELYTYTLMLLLIGAVLFYQSLARGSDMMRKAGLAVVGLAVAKVFLIDISGLGGLIRVFSLLALGLALAGLAWLNRWAKLRHSPQGAEPLDH